MADPPRTGLQDRETGDSSVEHEGGGQDAADLPRSDVSEPGNAQPDQEAQKPSRLKEWWGKTGLDVPTLMMMFKGSLPPTIAVAWYESTRIAEIYTTLGYLVPVITVLSMCIMPRAKYLQTLVLNVLGICVGSAVALLGLWSSVEARKHTTSAGTAAPYNSSQSAVCAIWLFANIWISNTLRAKFPALQFPVIMYSIFTNVAFTYGPLFQTVQQGEGLVKQLLTSFLSAFVISTAVHLFIIPVSCRTVVFKEQTGYIMAVKGALKAQTTFLQSLESSDMFTATDASAGDGQAQNNSAQKKKKEKKGRRSNPTQTPKAKALKDAISRVTALHGQLHGDIDFAKREAAWGKLDAKDIDEILVLFRGILIPLIGMSTIADIFERIAERRGWLKPKNPGKRDEAELWEQSSEEERIASQKTWNEVMKTLHEPFAVAVAAMDEGLQHAGLILELIPRPKKAKGGDEEAKGSDPKPGDPGFTIYLEQKMREFYGKRGETLRAWARQKGLSAEQFDSVSSQPPTDIDPTLDESQHRRDQQQLYLILYMEHLLYSTGAAIGDLARFADKKVAEGTMKKNRLIFPGKRRLKKWILGIKNGDSSLDTNSPDSIESGISNIYLGSGFNPKRDPEHLPPKTTWQHAGNFLRTIPRFLSSTECAFGFRVACATLTIGIVAFLKDTQIFFVQQRLVWAMIIIAIGMNVTSGQSMFGFFGRVVGTTLATVSSFVIWYIVNQKTPGIIVFLWLFIFFEMALFLKFPRFVIVWLITIVTQVMIIGYELQVRKLGVEQSVATGQPYYPIYKLAPYRLACVAGGSLVAFIWTIFPFPLSDRSWLRQNLGSTLYLLANYYSVVHSTIGARMHDSEGDMATKTSPGRQLERVRRKIFGKLLMLLPSLKEHADWQKWEPTVGGRFPRETYEGIALYATKIMNYLSLMSYATESWTKYKGNVLPNSDRASRRAWLNDLSALVDSVNPTSHQITSTLTLLSASVKQGSSLPPYIQMPEPYDLTRRLEALDKGILDARHVEEPGYSAYAVVQVISGLVTDDLARLVDHVKDLVGETDFSFKVSVLDTAGNDSTSSSKGKRE